MLFIDGSIGHAQSPVVRYTVVHVVRVPGHVGAGDARRAVAIQISEPIRLDGVLDEAVWAENSPIGEFIQVEPRTGEPPTEPTKAWIAYTKRRSTWRFDARTAIPAGSWPESC